MRSEMRNAMLLCGVLTATMLAGCSQENEAVGGAEPAEKQAGNHAPASKLTAKSAVAKSVAEPVVAESSEPEQREELRFDMTQNGEAQTAAKFDAWMKEQGVRVAAGESSGDAGSKPAQPANNQDAAAPPSQETMRK